MDDETTGKDHDVFARCIEFAFDVYLIAVQHEIGCLGETEHAGLIRGAVMILLRQCQWYGRLDNHLNDSFVVRTLGLDD